MNPLPLPPKGNITSVSIVLENPLAAYIGLAAAILLGAASLKTSKKLWARKILFTHPLLDPAKEYLKKPRKTTLTPLLVAALEATAIALLSTALANPQLVYEANTTLNQTITGEFHVKANPALILVVDVSGSMQGQKIEAAKQALLQVVEAAEKKKIDIGLIAFSDKIVAALPPGASKEQLEEKINSLKASGGTMYTYPLLTALNWLKPYAAFRIPAALVFATDGLPADTQEYRPLLEEYRKQKTPIYTIFIGTTPLGIEETRLIAEKTRGKQYTAKNIEELKQKLLEASKKAISHIVEAKIEAKITVKTREKKTLTPLITATATALAIASATIRYKHTKITI